MANVVRTRLGRILDLPVSIKDIGSDEQIEGTNAPLGRLYVSHDSDGVDWLNDLSLLDDEEDVGDPICLPLIEDLQLDDEISTLSLADKLMQIRDIENKRYS